MKTLLQTYLEKEIWILVRDKWYFAKVVGVGDDLLRFTHRTYDKDTEEDTLWEMAVKISEVIAVDKVISVISRKADVLISRLLETQKELNDCHEDNEH